MFFVVLETFLLIIVGELLSIEIDMLFYGSFCDKISLYLEEFIKTNLSYRSISVSF